MVRFPVSRIKRAAAYPCAADLQFLEPFKHKPFATGCYQQVKTVATAADVAENKVGFVVEISLVPFKTGDDLLKDNVGADGFGYTAQANAVRSKLG